MADHDTLARTRSAKRRDQRKKKKSNANAGSDSDGVDTPVKGSGALQNLAAAAAAAHASSRRNSLSGDLPTDLPPPQPSPKPKPAFVKSLSIEPVRDEQPTEWHKVPTPSRKEVEDLMEREERAARMKKSLSIEVSRPRDSPALIDEVLDEGQPLVTPSRKEMEDLMERELRERQQNGSNAGGSGMKRMLSIDIERPRTSLTPEDGAAIEPPLLLKTPTQKEVEDLFDQELRAMGVSDAADAPPSSSSHAKGPTTPTKQGPASTTTTPAKSAKKKDNKKSPVASPVQPSPAKQAAAPSPQPLPTSASKPAAPAPAPAASPSPSPARPSPGKLKLPEIIQEGAKGGASIPLPRPVVTAATATPAAPRIHVTVAPGSKYFPYDSLVQGAAWPEGIDPTKREAYVADDEFVRLFKMTRAEFNALKAWKQQEKKKEVKLF